MPVWASVVATMAALRVGIALALYLAGVTTVAIRTPLPPALYAWLALTFAVLGLILLAINRDDMRAAWLGGVLVLLAAPLTSPLMPAVSNQALGWVDRIRPEAFLGAFLWRFVLEFPSRPDERLRRAGLIVAGVVAAVAAVAAIVNLSLIVWPELGWRAVLSTGGTNEVSWYWTSVFLPSAAATVALLIRVLASTGEDRTRSAIFAAGLIGGLLPLVVEVLIEDAFPAYEAFAHQPSVEPWLALLLFGPLGLIPFITAYSVVYDRLLNLKVVVRAAIQYALARYTIAGATSVPFLALALYLYAHRAESLTDLASGVRPLLLLGAVGSGAVAFRLRRRLLHAIDRRYFREQYDTQQLFTALLSEDLASQTPDVLARRVAREFDRVLHGSADLFVLDDQGLSLCDPRGRRAPLDASAALMSLALADPRPMDVSLDTGTPFDRLRDSERAWLRQGPYCLLVALRSGRGEPVGLLALGAKRSELPYSATDRQAIAAILTPLSLAIDNDRLRRIPEPPTDYPGRECLTCYRMHAAAATGCSCGGSLVTAQAPHMLRGTFRFDRRIGAGGMGVVYRGVDLSLGREVAMKTLPHTTPEHARRLRREAQAMAAIVHPNLAVIYGIETWRSTPFLIEEYLAGGTLAHRLRGGRLDVGQALDLGMTLCGVLGELHDSGIVHCDIKPSNIGFTGSGVVKLLDFGLAHMLRDTNVIIETTDNLAPADAVDSVILTHRGVMGTPPYMCPEAIRAAQPAPGFDLWALSVVLFEAIAGDRPFRGATAHEVFDRIESGLVPDIREFRPECPSHLAAFFATALALPATVRPQTAPALRNDLSALRARVA